METCRIEGCDRPVYVKKRKLCAPHYSSMHKKGDLEELPHTVCVVEGCDARAVARSMCNAHYKRMRRTGDVVPRSLTDRFWQYVDKDGENGCWRWTGGHATSGYGTLRVGEGHVYVHRISYELLVGPIPDGLQVDHLCRNRGCLNPEHLEAVTQKVNILRGDNMGARWARRTECHVCGGELVVRHARGARVCMACQRLRSARQREREKAKRSAGLT